MKVLSIATCLLLSLSIFSCKKEKEGDNMAPVVVNHDLDFLENAVSDSCAEDGFYIKGEFNGKPLAFATTGQSGSYFVDTFSNAFFVYRDSTGHVTGDDVYMIRSNADESIQVAFYCGQTHITTRPFPYAQPHYNLEKCEFSSMQLMNKQGLGTAPQNSPQDNYTFNAGTGSNLQLRFTSLTPDNILTATFEGKIKTNTGSVINVKHGMLRIKFLVVDTKL